MAREIRGLFARAQFGADKSRETHVLAFDPETGDPTVTEASHLPVFERIHKYKLIPLVEFRPRKQPLRAEEKAFARLEHPELF